MDDLIGGLDGALTVIIVIVAIVAAGAAVITAGMFLVYLARILAPFFVALLAAWITKLVADHNLEKNQLGLWNPHSYPLTVSSDGELDLNRRDIDLSDFDFSLHTTYTVMIGGALGVIVALLFPYFPMVPIIATAIALPILGQVWAHDARKTTQQAVKSRLHKAANSITRKTKNLSNLNNRIRQATPKDLKQPFQPYSAFAEKIAGKSKITIPEVEEYLTDIEKEAEITIERLQTLVPAWNDALEFAETTRQILVRHAPHLLPDLARISARIGNQNTLNLLQTRQWDKFEQTLQIALKELQRLRNKANAQPKSRYTHTPPPRNDQRSSNNHQAPPPPPPEPKDNKLDWAYTTLGLTRDATLAEAKTRYKELAGSLHPDKVATRGEAVKRRFTRLFQELQEALDIVQAHLRRS